uniref:BZIP domain-containing protein n=1 Tax=Caenorhabditis tropicalis TaxID=1561998 RepID=A0A1I7UK11_9PELO
MNHHDPYYQQSSSAPSTSGSYSVYTQELNPDSVADDTLPSIVDSDQINPFLDDYYEDSDTKDHHSMSSHHGSNADDDLETLMKETDDMLDIQAQLQMEQLSPIDSVERSRQKRAAAARSRYQRMSENERRLYNQRRRLRQMGVDPNNTNADSETLKAQAKQANAKKAEAARLRYHRMTPEQKREYNQRRTEAFRRRRQEEEMLLSTPAGRISQEALQKAQQIMVRNARKAESARLRYQKMTQEQRKVYNTKRASAKRTRRDDGEDYVEYHHQEYMPQAHDMTEHKIVLDQDHMMHLEGLASPDPNDVIDEDEVVDDEVSQEHMLDVINNVAHPPDEMGIFAQMENEVIRQTKKANATILNSSGPSN